MREMTTMQAVDHHAAKLPPTVNQNNRQMCPSLN